jgi:tricarballylate dehydrogenase
MNTDVVVVGAGNAALSAALAAHEQGANILVLERAPEPERGGNSRFTGGAIRFVYNGIEDLRKVMPELTEEEEATTDFGVYSRDDFFTDMARITQYRSDPDMTTLLIDRSLDTLIWLRSHGIRFVPSYHRQAFKVDGKFKFWGGLAIDASGGGPGLVESLYAAIDRVGIPVEYETRVVGLLVRDGTVHGVCVQRHGKIEEIEAKAVVLASGGFEANTEWRTRYLGPGWDLAKVRGSRFNTGDGIRMALDIGAMPYGNWSGCHAVGWDRNAPEFGDLRVGDGFQKHSYPFGIMLNANGERFVDEGADFRNYTYAKYGRAVLEQPMQFAWQIFDSKVMHLYRDEYRIREVTKVRANTLEELVAKLDDVNPAAALRTIQEYNAAVCTDVPFNPTIKDGRGAIGLTVPKSNWANTIDTPPFEAYQVTCGITFTFGGLKINNSGHVINTEGSLIPGLYAACELVGGIFYFNYPGGTGLTSGAVFGKLAGESAGAAAASQATPGTVKSSA